MLLKKDTNMDRNNFKLRIDRMEDPKDANEPSFYPTSEQKKQEMTQSPPVLRAKNEGIRKRCGHPFECKGHQLSSSGRKRSGAEVLDEIGPRVQ